MAKAATKRLVEELGAVYFNIQPEILTTQNKCLDNLKIIDELFKEAKERQPSVISIKFLDVIIPIIHRRSGQRRPSQDAMEEITCQFINHLEKLRNETQIYVIGMTDRPFDLRPEGLRMYERNYIFILSFLS